MDIRLQDGMTDMGNYIQDWESEATIKMDGLIKQATVQVDKTLVLGEAWEKEALDALDVSLEIDTRIKNCAGVNRMRFCLTNTNLLSKRMVVAHPLKSGPVGQGSESTYSMVKNKQEIGMFI